MAANVAVVLPAPTGTVLGTVNAAALSDNETTTPPAGANELSVTVHVDDPPVPRDAGAHLRALRVGGGGAAAVTVPPTPFIVSEVPPGETPNVSVTLIAVLATPGAIVTLTTATTRFCIRVALKPASKHA